MIIFNRLSNSFSFQFAILAPVTVVKYSIRVYIFKADHNLRELLHNLCTQSFASTLSCESRPLPSLTFSLAIG